MRLFFAFLPEVEHRARVSKAMIRPFATRSDTGVGLFR